MELQDYQSARPRVSKAPSTSMSSIGQVASLSQRLEQFSGSMYKRAGTNAKRDAAENAVVDMAQYNDKVNDVLSNPNLTKKQVDTQLEDLQAKQEYDGWGDIYRNSYKDTFDSSYSNTVTNNANAVAGMMSAGSNGSSSNFIKSWNSYANSIVKTAPTPALAATAKMSLTKQGSTEYKKLATAEYAKDYKQREASSKEVLEFLETEYNTAYATGSKGEMDRAQSQFSHALNSAVTQGFLTTSQASVRLHTAKQDATISRFKTDFSQALNGGKNTAKVLKETYGSKEFQKLPQKKKDDLMKTLYSEMKDKDTRERQAKKDIDDFQTEQQEIEYRDTLKSIYSGDGSLAAINKAETKGELSQSDATSLRKTLSEGSRAFSDQQTITWYSMDANLADATESDIYEDVSLTWDDKTALIEKRESLLTTKEYKWTTTQNGREARSRIKRHFGFQEGTMMAQIDLNNKTQKAFNDIMVDMFDHISSLPEDEQNKAAIPYANQLLAEYTQGLTDAKENKIKLKREQKLKESDVAYKKYQNSWNFEWNKLTESEYKTEWLKENR